MSEQTASPRYILRPIEDGRYWRVYDRQGAEEIGPRFRTSEGAATYADNLRKIEGAPRP